MEGRERAAAQVPSRPGARGSRSGGERGRRSGRPRSRGPRSPDLHRGVRDMRLLRV
uniref:Uncharacterized protein n=1 Tax=Arundo donax TaxID=35708 RepID=A0A0A9FYP7_ARUDO